MEKREGKGEGGEKRRGKKENDGAIGHTEKEHGIPSRWETKMSEARNNYKIRHD